MKIKKLVSLLLAGVMMVSLVACGGGSTEETSKDNSGANTETSGNQEAGALAGKTVGFSQTDSMSSWRTTETDSIKASVEAAGGSFVVKDAGGDIATQDTDIRDLVASGVDYLVVAPLENNGLQGALEEAMASDIPVILVDRSIDGEVGKHFTTAIASDFVWEGAQCAEALNAALPEGGNVVIINGGYDSSTSTERQQGFVDNLNDNITVVAEQDGEWLMDKAQAVMENIIQAQGGENIDAVFAVTDDMVQGAMNAIVAANLKPGEDVLTLGIDGTRAALEAVEAGTQLASCTCTPYFGPIVVETITKLINGETVDAHIVNPDVLYTKENVDVEVGF